MFYFQQKTKLFENYEIIQAELTEILNFEVKTPKLAKIEKNVPKSTFIDLRLDFKGSMIAVIIIG